MIDNAAFYVFWLTVAYEVAEGWYDINVTDWAFDVFALLEAHTCPDAESAQGIAFVGDILKAVAVFEAVFFLKLEEDIAAVWTAHADGFHFFSGHSKGNNAFFWMLWIAIAVEVADDLLYKLIVIFWFYNTFWVAALEVDIDVGGTMVDSTGLGPVNHVHTFNAWHWNGYSVAEFFHNACIDTTKFANPWVFVASGAWNSCVVRGNANNGVFIEVIENGADVFVVYHVDFVDDVAETLPVFVTAFNCLFHVVVVNKVDAMQVDVEELPIWVGIEEVLGGAHVPIVNEVEGFEFDGVT